MNISLTQVNHLVRDVLFTCALCFCLASGTWIWGARISWTILTILFVMEKRYRLLALFFFSAFFIPSGFLPHFTFTIKHFHIVLFLSLLIDSLTNQLIPHFRKGVQISSHLLPVYILSGLLLLSGLFFSETSIQTYKTWANFLSILLALTYIIGFACSHFDIVKIIPQAVTFFLFGVSLQIVAGLLPVAGLPQWRDFRLIHNNHIGVLSAFSLFYALTLPLTFQRKRFFSLSYLLTLILFVGAILSCSRTSWFSLVFALGLFFTMHLTLGRNHPSAAFKVKMLILFFTFVLVGTAAYFGIPAVGQRAAHLYQVFDISSWKHAWADTQNFGFLGCFRRQQLFEIADIFRTNPIFGIGLQKRVLDFHGFYFTLAGAGGISALFLFAVFAFNTLNRLFHIACSSNRQITLWAIAVFCAFYTWLSCSLMETLFLQYSSWVNLVFAAFLFKAHNSIEHTSEISKQHDGLNKKLRSHLVTST